MTSKSLILGALFALAAMSHGAPVRAHDRAAEPGKTRAYGGVWLGFGRERGFARDAHDQLVIEDRGFDLDLGGDIGLERVLARHFSLGAEARLLQPDLLGERRQQLDLVVKPRLRFPTARGHLEIYFALPAGLSLARVRAADGDALWGVGWNVGLATGLQLFFTERLGLNVEALWRRAHLVVETDRYRSEEDWHQLSLLVNAVVAF